MHVRNIHSNPSFREIAFHRGPTLNILEAEDLVLKLADRPCLLIAEFKRGFLHGADHGWWAANQDLDILCGSGEFLL